MPFSIERSPHIADRRDMGALANLIGAVDAVEVGVDTGDWAFHFLSTWRGRTLHLIDPYLPYEGMPWPRDADKLIAIARLARFGSRAKFIQHPSPQAVSLIPAKRAIPFVYIDGAHDCNSVSADIAAWWDRLATGGVLAGHDYDPSHPGVMDAVDRFARNMTVYHTHETTEPPSWYIFKPDAE